MCPGRSSCSCISFCASRSLRSNRSLRSRCSGRPCRPCRPNRSSATTTRWTLCPGRSSCSSCPLNPLYTLDSLRTSWSSIPFWPLRSLRDWRVTSTTTSDSWIINYGRRSYSSTNYPLCFQCLAVANRNHIPSLESWLSINLLYSLWGCYSGSGIDNRHNSAGFTCRRGEDLYQLVNQLGHNAPRREEFERWEV